jgi:tripartite-type tricarboxylate transporter receptor subunit TctC
MGRRFAHNLVAVAATLGAMVAALAAATGGDWPAKPVRVIVA